MSNGIQFALSIVAGVLSGILSGAFGVGGAVVSTPLVRLIGISPLQAIGTTLPAILPSAISGSIRYNKAGLIRWKVIAVTAPLGVLSAIVFSYVSHSVPGNGHILMIATAVILGFTAIRMAKDNIAVDDERHEHDSIVAPTFLGFAAGGLSGLLGVGGGTITVPGFRAWMKMPIKAAIATSLVCVGVFAIPSTIAHARIGDIDWTIALGLAIGVIPGASIGSHLAIKASEHRLRIAVSSLLGFVAITYGFAELFQLIK